MKTLSLLRSVLSVARFALFVLISGVVGFVSLIGDCRADEGEAVSPTPGSAFVFFDGAKSKFIQIGDNEGSISDIDGFLTGIAAAMGKDRDDLFEYVGEGHEFSFTLRDKPAAAVIEVKVYSLVDKANRYDCKTTIEINDGDEFDLRNGENVGSGKTTVFSKEISNLRAGENEIRFEENPCDPSGWNDSLILSGQIRFK